MTTQNRPAGNWANPEDQADGRSALSVAHDGNNRSVGADRRRQRIKLLLETMIQNRGKVLDLITEASEKHDHIALGFKSWTEYVSTEFAGLLARLTVEDRRETVLILSRTGLSTRAIAPIVGTNHSTIVRDLQSGGADAPPADDHEIQPHLRSEEAFVEHLGMRPDEADALISSGLVTNREEFDEAARQLGDHPAPERTVVGLDEKRYRAPKPKPRRASFPDAYRYAVDDLDKVVRRIEKLHADDRFLGHREDLQQRRGGLLSEVAWVVSEIESDLGGHLNCPSCEQRVAPDRFWRESLCTECRQIAGVR